MKIGLFDTAFVGDPSITHGQTPPTGFEYIRWPRDMRESDCVMATCEDAHRALSSTHPRRVLFLQETSETHPPTDLEMYRKFDLVLTHDQRVIDALPNARYLTLIGTWITEWSVPGKTKSVSMIASSKNLTSGHKLRQEVAARFRDRVDGFGRAFGEGGIARKETGIMPYRFHVVIENSSEDCWITEKTFDAMACKSFLLFRGCEGIKEALHNLGFSAAPMLTWTDADHLGEILRVIEAEGESLYESVREALDWNYRRIAQLYCCEVEMERVIRDFFGLRDAT